MSRYGEPNIFIELISQDKLRCGAPRYFYQDKQIFSYFSVLKKPMGDTYIQAYFHLVFAVQNRKAIIQESWKDEFLFEFFNDVNDMISRCSAP